MYYFNRVQKYHQLHGKQRRNRLLRLVVLPTFLTCGLLVTVGLLWLTRGDSSKTDVPSDLSNAEAEAETATTSTNELVDALSSSDAKVLSLESLWNRVRASVVQVRSERGLGSGFVVGEDLVATNHHVVVASKALKVYFQDGTSADVEGFAAADVDRDLAVIRVATGKKAIPLSFAQEPPSVGDPVAAVSFFERTGGQIASAPDADRTFIATTAKGEHGYSGGPLVDGEGNVVGMVCGQVPDTPETMAIPAADIRDLILSSLNSRRPLPVPGAQIEVGTIHGNPDHGIRVSRQGWAIVTVSDRSHIRGCLGHGMYVRGNHNSIDVLGGTIHENGGHGIFLWGSNNILRISGGEISANQGHGVLVEGDNNVISVSDCRILNNHLRGLTVKGSHNKVEVSGGTILGKNGADLRMIGHGNTCVVTGGVFGDDGSGRDGAHRALGHRAKALHVQALLSLENGKTDDAIQPLQEAIRLNPAFARAYSSRGYVYYLKGDYLQALHDFDEAIRLNPQLALAYSNRGCAYRASAELGKAVTDFSTAIQLDRTPEPLLERHRLRGACFRRIGDNVRAIDDFVEAMRITAEAVDPYNWRNDYYSEVLKLLSDAIERGDGVTAGYHARGRIHYKRGDFEKTVSDCTRAIDLDGELPFAYVLRALAYERANDHTEADADYAKARQLIENAMDLHELDRPSPD
jgi:tetratricopeptide (TPR) repeat protein/S1-C subfamily serine protease